MSNGRFPRLHEPFLSQSGCCLSLFVPLNPLSDFLLWVSLWVKTISVSKTISARNPEIRKTPRRQSAEGPPCAGEKKNNKLKYTDKVPARGEYWAAQPRHSVLLTLLFRFSAAAHIPPEAARPPPPAPAAPPHIVTTAQTGRWSFSFSCSGHSAPCMPGYETLRRAAFAASLTHFLSVIISFLMPSHIRRVRASTRSPATHPLLGSQGFQLPRTALDAG